MLDKKWLTPFLPYLAVWAGLFFFKNAWLALTGFHLAILVALAFVRPTVPFSLLFRSKNPKWILFSVFFCSTSGIGLYCLWEIFGIVPDLPAQLQSLGLNSSTWTGFIIYFALVNPFIEEYFWRGFLGNISARLQIGDVIFAGYHALILWGKVNPVSIFFAVSILVSAGWLWRQISRLDEGLLAAVFGHAVADFSILMVIRWMCS
jgi:hypothetical protein